MPDVEIIGGRPPRHSVEELRRLLRPALVRGGATRAWIFGSRARGEADAWSDLDLLIEVRASDLPFVERWRAFAAVLDVEAAADLLVYTADELAHARAAGNPFIVAAMSEAVPIDVG
jgi:predicted nucleotidyltransferase